MTTPGIPPSWSKAQVCEAWKVSPKAIDRLIKEGKVGYYRAGRSRRFYAEHIGQIRAALAVEPQPADPRELAGLTARSSARRRTA
jgi:excisionase family DNA binding protein